MAIVIGSDIFFISDSEQDANSPTVFTIRALTLQQRAKLEQLLVRMQDKTKDSSILMETALEVCCMGVGKIEGLVDPYGQAVELPVKEALSLLPDPNILGELMTAIIQHNYLAEAQAKNSERPPRSGRPEKPVVSARIPPATKKTAANKSKR